MGGTVLADCGEDRKGRRRVFVDKFCFLDNLGINLLQLKPLSEFMDFGRQPACIPLEDAVG